MKKGLLVATLSRRLGHQPRLMRPFSMCPVHIFELSRLIAVNEQPVIENSKESLIVALFFKY